MFYQLIYLLFPQSMALTCYDYMVTPSWSPAHVTVECPPDTKFCYSSYLENQDSYGNLTKIEAHSCASAAVCQATGCGTNPQDYVCCCSQDACNSTPKVSTMTRIFLCLFIFLFHR